MKLRLAAMATLAPMSTPNQTITSGAKAIFGTPLMATMRGRRIRATVSDSHSARPNALPSVVPIAKPTIASNAVAPMWTNSSPSRIRAIPFSKMPEGCPYKWTGATPLRTSNSQVSRMPSTNRT
ncbi:hypothetical protein D9M68_779730 [compost metagenome]